MFTGIVTAVGTVNAIHQSDGGRTITVHTPDSFLAGVREGDSVAIDGVCQTVTALPGNGLFTVHAIGTTLSRTTLAGFERGRRVNLELALALGDRLGGHIVQGHVDGVGTVVSVRDTGDHVLLDVTMPDDVADVTTVHGSITIDGVSLTVNELTARDRAQVALIPYTWEHTNLSRLAPGSTVNLEGDMLGRFVIHYLQRRDDQGGT